MENIVFQFSTHHEVYIYMNMHTSRITTNSNSQSHGSLTSLVGGHVLKLYVEM